jgi:hypothetical protein
MARYVRTGGVASVGVGTTGAGTAPSMPNHGVSFVTSSTAEAYVLEPPTPGVEKTIIFTGTSSTGLVHIIRGSTAQTVTFSGGTLGDNTALPTMFKLAATRSTNVNVVVKLIGVSTTSWAFVSVYPPMVTGNGAGSITVSTT